MERTAADVKPLLLLAVKRMALPLLGSENSEGGRLGSFLCSQNAHTRIKRIFRVAVLVQARS